MSDSLTFRLLRYIKASAENLNFTRAAEQVFVAQSSLSHQIGKLEDNIDIAIFERLQNGLKLTPAGRIVAAHAENTLREWDQMLVMARAVQRNEVPPLRLGFSSFINAKLLEKFREGYERMFSGCVIQLMSGDPLLSLQRLDSRMLDCAILPLPIDAGLYTVQQIAQSPLVVCMRSDDVLADRALLEIGDVAPRIFELEKAATILESHMSDSIGLKVLGKEQAFQFFSYLFNLEEWASDVHLRSDAGVDRQLVKAPVEWHSEHLRIGRRYVQMFPLTNTPEISRPCLFTNLMELDCDSILCSVWRPQSDSATRKEVTSQEKFLEFFKLSPFQRLMSGKNTAPLEATATAKAVAGNVDNLTEVVSSLDKLGQGDYALRLLLSAGSASELRAAIPAVHRLFVDARAPIMEETYGNLSAFYAMFPGNRQFNVYPLWLREDHHARLSSIFAPHLGHTHSDDLDAEYLNIFETRTRTPYFQDAYVNGVRVQLIIGPTGTGKSVHACQMLSLEQKYGGFTFIFDIGGSYESVVELYGGRIDRVGKDGPRINPFALEPTETNIAFLHSFIKLLLTSSGATIGPEDDDDVFKSVKGIYNLPQAMRRLGNANYDSDRHIGCKCPAPKIYQGDIHAILQRF
jgi:hypothetical protein